MKNNRKLKLSIYDYSGNEVCPIYDSEVQVRGQATDVICKAERNGWREFSFNLPGDDYRAEYVRADYKLKAIDDYGIEWYIITQPRVTHSGKSKNISVTAGHVCQLLKTKNMALEFSDDEGNNVGTCAQLLATALDGTGWEVGSVAEFKEKDGNTIKVRSLNASSKTGAFKLVSMICELFEAKPIYRSNVEVVENGIKTIHKVVDVKPMNPFSEAKEAIYDKVATYADGEVLELHYGKNVSNVSRTLKTDNLVTCLYAYGAYGDTVSKYCSIQECKHTEFEFTLTAPLTSGTQYYFTVTDDANVSISRSFTPSQSVASGTKLIWSLMDRASMSYIWDESKANDEAATHAYRVYEGAHGTELPATITTKRNEVTNVFPFIMDYSYYLDCGLFADSMLNKLSWFQRKSPEYLSTVNEKTTDYTTDWLALTNAIGQINFAKLKYTSVQNDDGSIRINLDNDKIFYRTDYDAKRHFKWRNARSLKDNGDPINNEAAVVYAVHNTNPLTYDKFYLKKVNGETDPLVVGSIDEEDITNITLWGDYSKFSNNDEFYLFETNGVNGLLGAKESAYEALVISLDSALKEVTMQHPVFFSKSQPVIDESVTVPSTKLDIYKPEWANFNREYAWWYEYNDTSSPGTLHFCYWADGDRDWHVVYVSNNEPNTASSGSYFYNWRTAKLYRRTNDRWIHLDSDDDEKVASKFGVVYGGCLTRDKLYIGEYQTYTYEPNETIAAGNWYMPTDYLGYWLFTAGCESDKLEYDTTTGFMTVYPHDPNLSENTVEVKNARFDNVFYHKENILDTMTVEEGAISTATGGDIEGICYRCNFIPLYSNLTYAFSNYSGTYTIYYYTLKHNYIKSEVFQSSSNIVIPNNARYIRIASSNNFEDMTAQFIAWNRSIISGEETYYLLGSPVGTGELKGINAQIANLKEYGDKTYLVDIPALQTAQEEYKQQELNLKDALGELYRESKWQDSKYVDGDEDKLYSDALDTLKEVAKPEVTYNINFVDQYCVDLDAYGSDLLRWPDFDTNSAVHLIDPDIGVNCWAYVDTTSKCYDDSRKTTITINTNLNTAAQHSFTDILTNIANVSSQVKAKDTIYDRAANITSTGKWTAEKLEGTIDANRLKITGGSSTWYTDKNGNMVFEAADGSGAMMLTGNGMALANARNKYGEWIWRSFMNGNGATADEIVTGTMSAERLQAGSITTDKISSSFGETLDLSSNKGINLKVSSIKNEIENKVEDLVGYRMEIISTSDILSSDIQTTTLFARVWHGSENVTDSIPASKFAWKRVSSDSTADRIWNENHAGIKTFTLTTMDVLYSATYTCELSK